MTVAPVGSDVTVTDWRVPWTTVAQPQVQAAETHNTAIRNAFVMAGSSW